MPIDNPDNLKNREPNIETSPTQSQTLRVESTVVAPIAEGTIIAGQYKVLSSLGSGGMSHVYRCQDLSLNRTVAVKLLQHKSNDNPQALLRFQREGKAIAMLEHENIVRVYSLQCPDNQSPFLVMEVVGGMSLSDLVLKNGQLPPKRALKLLAQICDALSHAHANGVIHRDLKPSNFMLVDPGMANEKIKILDFGIAKIADEKSIKATQTGEVFGSPAYMSPEQALGQKVDEKTDQYSLGCVAFELLTGRPPFTGDNNLSVLMSHVQDEPPAVSAVSKQPIPTQIEKTIMKLLAKNPQDRFASVNEAKQAFLGHASVKPSPSKSQQKSLPKSLVAVAGVVFVALIGTAVWFLHPGESNNKETPRITQRVLDAENDPTIGELSNDSDIILADIIAKNPTELNLHEKKLTGISNTGMQQFRKATSLGSLDLSNCGRVTSVGFECLLDLPLKRLNLNKTNLTDKDLSIIGRIKTLTYLSMQDDFDIDDDGLKSLAGLTDLDVLSLNSTAVTGNGLKYLQPFKKLHLLILNHLRYMSGNLAPLRTMPDLRQLSLENCGLHDDDIRTIVQCKKLKELHLNGNGLSNKVMPLLAKLPELESLSMYDTGISAEDRRNFLATSPQCRELNYGPKPTKARRQDH